MDVNLTNDDITMDPLWIPSQIVFYVFLFSDIVSLSCSLILFYYFIRLPELHRDESNLTVIYLLIVSFLVTSIDIPIMLPYLHGDYYIYSLRYPKEFCMFWILLDYVTYSISLWLMSLACFQNYVLIFFKLIVTQTKCRRLFLYHISVFIVVILIFSWYFYLVVFYPCQDTQFDFHEVLCGFSCYEIEANAIILNIDWIVFILIPIFLTAFFVLILVIHTVYHKHKIRRHLIHQQTWKRTRKMFLKLFPIIVLYLVFNLPLIIFGFVYVLDPFASEIIYFYTNSLAYCVDLLMPFAVLSKQSIIRNRLAQLIRLRPDRRIRPRAVRLSNLRS